MGLFVNLIDMYLEFTSSKSAMTQLCYIGFYPICTSKTMMIAISPDESRNMPKKVFVDDALWFERNFDPKTVDTFGSN